MKTDQKLSITLSKEDCEKLRTLAEESFRSRAGYVRHVVTLYLREIERDPTKKIP